MKIQARKTFQHDRLGVLEKGVAVDVPEAIALKLIEQGHATAADVDAAGADETAKPAGKRKPAAKS